MFPLRSRLYFARLDKRRPVLVVSPDYRNANAQDVIIVPASTRLRPMPTHVELRAGEGGIKKPSTLKCEQIMTIPRSDLEPTALGPPLVGARMRQVEAAVLRAIGIPVPLEG